MASLRDASQLSLFQNILTTDCNSIKMSRLSKNIVYNLLGQVCLLILGFVSIKYIFRHLGEDALGILYFAFMLNSFLCAALGLGIEPLIVREVAYHIRDKKEYVQRLIKTAAFIFWVIFLCLSIALITLSPAIVEKWLNLKSMDHEIAVHMLRVLSVSILMTFPLSVYTATFKGLQRMGYPNFIQVAITLLQQGGIIVVIKTGGSLLSVSYWIATSNALLLFVNMLFLARFIEINTLIPAFSADIVRKNIYWGSRMSLVSIMAFLHTQGDKLIISKLLPLSVLGYYSIAYSYVSKPLLYTASITDAAYPLFCELHKSGDEGRVSVYYRKIQDACCYGTLPIFGFILYYNQALFSYMFSEKIAEGLLMPTLVLCCALFLQTSFVTSYRLMLAMGEAGIIAKISSYNLIISLPAAFIAINYWGLTGAGVALLLSRCFVLFYGVPKISKKCLKQPVKAWYLHLMTSLLLFVMSYGIVLLILFSLEMRSLFSLTLGYLFSTIIYLVGAWFLIGIKTKEGVINLLRRRLSNAAAIN